MILLFLTMFNYAGEPPHGKSLGNDMQQSTLNVLSTPVAVSAGAGTYLICSSFTAGTSWMLGPYDPCAITACFVAAQVKGSLQS